MQVVCVGILQGGKIKRKDSLIERNGYAGNQVFIVGGNIGRIRFDRRVVDLYPCEEQPGDGSLVVNAIRVKAVETFDASKQERSVPGNHGGIEAKLVALQSIGLRKVPERIRSRVVTTQTIIGAEPEIALTVFQYPQFSIVGQTFLCRQLLVGSLFPVEQQQPTSFGANPKMVPAILVNASY